MSTETKVISLLREQLQGAHQFLEGVLEGVTADQTNWSPPGLANPLGATYAHIVITEDGIINGSIRGAAPLFASAWAGKTGFDTPPPSPNPEQPGIPDWSGWARQVQVELPALREYAQAVYAASEAHLAALSDADLNRSIDLSALGLGERTVGQLLNTILANTHWHTGEISCLKGLQGLKGYPI